MSEADHLPNENGPNVVVGVAVNTGQPQHEEDPDTAALKSLFAVTLDTRNFEIAQLVQRNNFFMIFQGVLLAGVVQSGHPKPIVSCLICLAGLLVSICQVQMAAGAKFWQECWEQTLHELERELVKRIRRSEDRKVTLQLFHEQTHRYEEMVKQRSAGKSGLVQNLIMKRFSVSKAPIHVGLVLTVVWSLLLLCTLRGYPPLSIPSFVVGF